MTKDQNGVADSFTPTRRTVLKAGAATSLVAGTPAIVRAQTPAEIKYPAKPVRLIVPFGPGSATDMVARIIADELNRVLGQFFVVVNRPGGNGFIGAQAAAVSPPDGYTLLVSSASVHTLNPSLFRKLPYDPDKDFTPVGGIHKAYYVLAVAKELPVNSVAELVSWLRSNPGRASYGWGATVSQVAGSEFLKRVGVQATGVPYKSSPEAMVDLMSGQISFMFDGVPTAQALILSNRVKGLAVTSLQRLPELSSLPTMAEAGVRDFDISTWAGLFAPAGTPSAIVHRLNSALQKLLRDQALAKRLDSCCSVVLFPNTPQEFGDYLKSDRAFWSVRLKETGIEPQ